METLQTGMPPAEHANLFQEAYERLLPELEALDPHDLIHINLDIQTAVSTALGCLPEIRALEAELIEKLPTFDLGTIDKLEVAAYALSHAQTLYVTATRPADDLQDLVARATMLRATLLKDAEALAHRGLLDGRALEEIKRPLGYRAFASHLQVLVELFDRNWERVQGKTSVLRSELDEATTLASRILVAVGLREQGPTLVAESANMRNRAFTLFVRTYDRVRRAITYLRWDEGDVDDITPSLWANRSARRKAGGEDDRPFGGSEPVTPAPASAVAALSPAEGARQDLPPGYPNSNPFIS